MVDTATGASPPRSLTNDMACSAIRFRPLIQSTSGRGFHSSSNFLNQEDKSTRENIMMRKYVVLDDPHIVLFNIWKILLTLSSFCCRILDNEQSSLSLPASCSNSSNTTPILSSLSTTRPVSLMSLGKNILFNCFRIYAVIDYSFIPF